MDVTTVLLQVTCAACGIEFFLTGGFVKNMKETHKGFYCPMGHSNYYPQKNTEEILRERLNQSENRITQLREISDNYQELLHKEKRSKAAHKANYTRLKKRVEIENKKQRREI